MPLQTQTGKNGTTGTMSAEERAKHAKGKMILVVGIIMVALFFSLLITLAIVSLSSA
jgi:hypothetical protein